MLKSAIYRKKKLSAQYLGAFQEFDSHEFFISLNDKDSSLKAFIAVHSRNLGIAHGGTRMKFYSKESDAIKDVLNLSKAMSYKSAMAGLPYGGAKGVIIYNDKSINRAKILQQYAEKIEALGGLFHTGTDVGLTDEDIIQMSKYTKYMLGIPKSGDENYSTSKAAATGVYYAIKAAAKFKFGSEVLKQKIIGIKGVGKLGGELVKLLAQDGTTLIIADTNPEKVSNIKEQFPQVTVVDPREIHKQTLDIYVPCALGNEFNERTIKDLNCKIIVGGANNQLTNVNAGELLHNKGILYGPDYIVNAGGLIFVSDELEPNSFHIDRVLKRIKGIQNTLLMIFEQSRHKNLPTSVVADMIAKERIASGKI